MTADTTETSIGKSDKETILLAGGEVKPAESTHCIKSLHPSQCVQARKTPALFC